MPQWTIPILTNILPALFIAVVTSFLTVRLSLRRFRAEHWWERKDEAYSRIVEALHQVMEYHAAMSKTLMTGEVLDKAQVAKLCDEPQKGFRELRRATRIGAYIISEDVAAVLAALDARPHPQRIQGEPASKLFDAELTAYKKALEQIRRLAKKDLNVP